MSHEINYGSLLVIFFTKTLFQYAQISLEIRRLNMLLFIAEVSKSSIWNAGDSRVRI